MLRLRAAVWAILVTVAVFGAAFVVQRWLLGSVSFSEVVTSKWFGAAALGFNTVAIAVVAVILALRTRRAERKAEEEVKALRAAAERFRDRDGKAD